MTDVQQTTQTRSQTGGWIVFAGAVVAILGAVVLFVAHTKKATAQRVLEFSNSQRMTPALQAATTASHVGLGVLIFGLALLLCGVVATAIKH